jgi:hypothetical protein
MFTDVLLAMDEFHFMYLENPEDCNKTFWRASVGEWDTVAALDFEGLQDIRMSSKWEYQDYKFLSSNREIIQCLGTVISGWLKILRE